eukprot:9518462-Lingulodinium_polyedra.AAC.1
MEAGTMVGGLRYLLSRLLWVAFPQHGEEARQLFAEFRVDDQAISNITAYWEQQEVHACAGPALLDSQRG